MKRVWINRHTTNYAPVVWVELGGAPNRLLWIMPDGKHGVTLDNDGIVMMSELLERDDRTWERIS